jgi:hypothetical protein
MRTDGRLKKSAEYLKVLIDVTKEGFGRIETEMIKDSAILGTRGPMLDKQDQMLDKQDHMLDKQTRCSTSRTRCSTSRNL